MVKHAKRRMFFGLLITSVLSLTGCMDASLSRSGEAPALISILDVPPTVTALRVSIRGERVDIEEIIRPGTDALVFDLLVGREHVLTVDTAHYLGRSRFTVPPRGAQIDVRMEEKLLVPDGLNARLVRVDHIGGANWTPLPLQQEPSDLALGPDGRIYVVAGDDLLAWSSFAQRSPEAVVRGVLGLNALAVDRNAKTVLLGGYYIEGGAFLEAHTLNGTLRNSYGEAVGDFADLWGLSSDEAGNIYVSGLTEVEVEVQGRPVTFRRPLVRKFAASAPGRYIDRVLGPRRAENSDREIDVLFSDGRLFVTNPSGADGEKIVVLDARTLAIVGAFGAYPAVPDRPRAGELYGPRRFVAVNNPRLTVIDESSGTADDHDRLVQFTPDRSMWRAFGGTGPEVGEFRFFRESQLQSPQ